MLTNATTNLRRREISRASGKRFGYKGQTFDKISEIKVTNTKNALHVHLRTGDCRCAYQEVALAAGRILITGEKNMPIADQTVRRIAAYWLLYKKVCRKCGALNPFEATKCRRCHSTRLRQKKRETKK